MVSKSSESKIKDPNYNDDYFSKLLGNYLRNLRINAGFKTIEAFANTIGMTVSQYGEYEAGKNMTIFTLKRIFLEFNIKIDDLFKIDFSKSIPDETTIESLNVARKEQVREQVEIVNGITEANKLNDHAIERFISILLFCFKPKSKKEILTDLLYLKNTVNNFNRVAGLLKLNGWIEITDKVSTNSPRQQYVTTKEGLRILKLG